MAVVGIVIVINITTDFVGDTSQHSDIQEFNSLHDSIEQECDRLDELESLPFSSSVSLELRDAPIELDGNTLYYDRAENTDESLNREIECNYDLENEININNNNGEIPTGFNTILIEESGDGIMVSDS